MFTTKIPAPVPEPEMNSIRLLSDDHRGNLTDVPMGGSVILIMFAPFILDTKRALPDVSPCTNTNFLPSGDMEAETWNPMVGEETIIFWTSLPSGLPHSGHSS